MTLILREPFENLNNWTISGSATVVAGRTGNGAQINSSVSVLYYSFPASADIVFGCAFRTASIATGVEISRLTGDGATSTWHGLLNVTSAGAITYGRASTVLGTSAAGIITANTWYYIEARLTLGDAGVGSFEIRVNGATVLGPTIADTKAGGTIAGFDRLRLAPSANIANVYDDLYLKTGAGETFLGDTAFTNEARVARQAARVAFQTPGSGANITRIIRHSVRVALGPAPVGPTMAVWTGTAFVDAPLLSWSGSAFVIPGLKEWDGATFVDVP